MQLQPGTLLKAGSYRIIRTLGRGGFGITYLAEQVMVRRQVCVKEFFPKDYYKRDGDTRNITLSSDGFGQMMDKFKTKFLKEAQIIAGLDHPNIIRIHDVFEENGTAYYVMEYIEGESLQSIVSRRGALGRDEAVGYIEQLAAALGYIHAHDIAHLDVKPGNVMVRSKDDRALLIDFGLSKHYDSEGMQTSSTPLGISHGFAPIEQYQVGGVSTFSPRTDIYSMGATLYYLAMGKVPPAAANVGEDGLDELPSHFGAGVCTAIERSMQYRRKDRPASAEEFMSLVRGGGQTTFVDGPKRDEVQRREPQRDPRPEPRPSKPEGDEPKKSKWWLWLLLAVVGVICGIALMGGDDENPSTADMYYAAPAEETTEPVDSVAVDSLVLEPIPEPEQKPEDKPEPTLEPVKLPDPILTLKSKSSVTFDADGGSGKITYTLTNPRDDMQLSVESNANWVSVSRSGDTLSYNATANNGESSRSAKITVTYGDQSFEVVITQAGKPKPDPTPEPTSGPKPEPKPQDDDSNLSASEMFEQGWKYYNDRNYTEAVKWYRKAAEQGNSVAQNNLGVCYEIGKGVAQSYTEAVKWYSKAAEQDYAIAQNNLGVCYEIGKGVAQSYTEAVKWYRKAAEQGNIDAQNNLGSCYLNGCGIAQSYTEAVKWYRKAAEHGSVEAQFNLGVCYETGKGVAQSYTEAVKWYRKAAEQGYAYAQTNLGSCYYYGHGITQSYTEAVKWFRKAAEQGNSVAQNGLGLCYYYGHGIAQSYTDAVKWLRKAAEQGLVEAREALTTLGETW